MKLKTLIQEALKEDIGRGDITTDAVVGLHQKGCAVIRAKQNLVAAGLDLVRQVFLSCDPSLKWKALKKDGQRVKKGAVLARVEGKASAILKGERTALNFLQHLCGVATQTRAFVDAVRGTKAKILDTRKTLPGWRLLEKYAVCVGGGTNHRIGLYDRTLIKNNHIALAGGIEKAIQKIVLPRKRKFLLEVEVKNLRELRQALKYPVDVILLDNFLPRQIRQALRFKKSGVRFEASGSIHLKNVRAYAKTGVDFISVGALTHSAPAADIHLVFSF